MKVELIETPQEQEITYPCLMIDNLRQIVLFNENKDGTCVCVGNSSNTIGAYSEMWAMEMFKPYTGKVVLSND